MDRDAIAAVTGHLFAGSAAMLAIEVAGFAAILSMLTPRVVECLAPRSLDERNLVVGLLIPYFIGSFAWVGTVLTSACCLLLVFGGISIQWLRTMLAIGAMLFVFCTFSNLKLMGVLIQVIDMTSRFASTIANGSGESKA